MSDLDYLKCIPGDDNRQLQTNYIDNRKDKNSLWNGYWLKWQRQWKPGMAIFLLTIALAFLGTTLLKKTYQSTGKILFKIDKISSFKKTEKDRASLKAVFEDRTSLNTEIEVISSLDLLKSTIESLKLKNDRGEQLKPQELKDNLNLKILKDSNVIEVSYRNSNLYTAADVVNTLMNIYIETKVNSQQKPVSTAKDYINKQIPAMEKKVLEAETNFQDFKKNNNIVILEKESASAVSEIAKLDREIVGLETQLAGVKTQASNLQTQLGLNYEQALAVNKLANSSTVEVTLEELKIVEETLAKEKRVYQSNHPNILNLEEEKIQLNKKLQQEIQKNTNDEIVVTQSLLKIRTNQQEDQLEKLIASEAKKINLSKQVDSLSRSRSNYQKKAERLPALEKKQQDLIRTINLTKTSYETLLTKLKEIEVAEKQDTIDARIIEPAILPEQASSAKIPLMALGVILGLLLAQIAVLLLEFGDKTLKTIPEIREIFAYNVLGVIPLEETKDRAIAIENRPESFISEMYRKIQVNLKLLNLDRQKQVILLTSSVAGEGKTTTSANLAAAIAKAQSRVLLIDGDLRNPSQAKLWRIEDGLGLTDVLSGKATLAEAVVKPATNLDLLLTGQDRVNPLAFLDSLAMSNLIESAKKEYDLIIIDAPPLLVSADVLALGKTSEGIVLVSRPTVVEQEAAAIARENLEASGQKVLGLIINGVNQQEFDRYFHYVNTYFSNQNPENLI